MSTSNDRSFDSLFNTGRDLERGRLTLPDNTPALTRREREIIQSGQQTERADRSKSGTSS